MGVPAVLTETGLTDIIELQLNADEQAAFQASADIVAADIAALR